MQNQRGKEITMFDIPTVIMNSIPKGTWLSLEESFKASASKAHTLIRDNAMLTGRRANQCSGFLRYHLSEEQFETLCPQYGGVKLLGGALPNLDTCVYQPYQVFDNVVLGFATHMKTGELPKKNQSRQNACQLNLGLEPMLPAPRLRVVPKNIFALMLISRDSRDPSKLAGIEIVVIDATLDHFIFNETLPKFLERYSVAEKQDAEEMLAVPKKTETPLVKLKQEFKRTSED